MWATYFPKGELGLAPIPQELFDEVKEKISKQELSADLFDRISAEIFQAAMRGPLRINMANFAVALLYRFISL